MAEPIVPNVVVSMPSQLFTLARSFKAAANGKIYIGKIDTDPTIPENQIQVYLENEDGTHIPVGQPLILNAGGYPVYGGQIAKFVTVQGHSMVVYDAYNVQQFYFPNVLKYDPDQLRVEYEQFINDLHGGNGAGLVGFSPFNYYPSATTGNYLAQIPGSDNTNTNDSTAAFNAAILKLAMAGGGILKPEPGVYKINGSVLIPTDITLDLHGCTLSGNGNNTLIAAGAVVNGALIDITSEYGTGDTGNGVHFVFRACIRGGVLKSAGIGIRGHRFNNGTSIEYVTFDSTLKQSWITSHSWGLKVAMNTVYAPAIMKDFVDWTEISGNTFEGNNVYTDGYIALTITTGGYGGSYSARLINNAFHRMYQGVSFTCEGSNTVIESNHFESTVLHIDGNSNARNGFRIKNNWMKANLLNPPAAITAVTAMRFGFIINSELGPNFYSNDRGPNYDYYINASGSNVYGNTVYVGYKSEANTDYTKFNLNEPNQLVVLRGSNDPTVSQPEIDTRSGSGVYTMEKYKANYNDVRNSLPGCTVTYSGTEVVIKTWIPWVNGCQSLCAFNLKTVGELKTIRFAGTFCLKNFAVTANADIYGATGESYTLDPYISSSTDGFTVITLKRAPTGGYLTGWIKQM